jgi:hypothetical protein
MAFVRVRRPSQRQLSLWFRTLLSCVSRLFKKLVACTLWVSSKTKALFTRIYASLFCNQKCSCPSTPGHVHKICKHEKWKAFRSCSIHIPPVAITATLLYLNISEIYWEEVGAAGQSLRLNALQFAAKLHEVFIVTSLSVVIINYMQYELLDGIGLSLGNVLAGFQITSLNSIFGLRLWNKLSWRGFKARHVRFLGLLTVLVFLCSITGPSSAILILPATGWWSVKGSLTALLGRILDSEKGVEFRLFLNASSSALWPSHITTELFLP